MRQVAEAKQLVRAAEANLKQLREADRPKEPADNGSVITFEIRMKTWAGNNKTYQYAAIKAGGRWFTTGATCPSGGWEWSQLIDWIKRSSTNGNVTISHLDTGVFASIERQVVRL